MDVLLSLSEASKIMKCSYSKAQKLARGGELPFKKIGCSWGISRNQLYRSLGLDPPEEEPEKGRGR